MKARPYLARYRLANGARGTLHIIAATSCDAVMTVLELFGDRVHAISVKAAA